MPGTPSSRGCDGCRRQKKKVSMTICLIINSSVNNKSATKPSQHAEDVNEWAYHVLEMASNDGNFTHSITTIRALLNDAPVMNRPSSRLRWFTSSRLKMPGSISEHSAANLSQKS